MFYLGLCQLPSAHPVQLGHGRLMMWVTQLQPHLWSWLFWPEPQSFCLLVGDLGTSSVAQGLI